jgi:hypothetical protein
VVPLASVLLWKYYKAEKVLMDVSKRAKVFLLLIKIISSYNKPNLSNHVTSYIPDKNKA